MKSKAKSKINLARLDNSVVFKKLFRDPDILREFIKDLLGLDINLTAAQIETEKKFTPPVGNVDISYDIFVDDPKNRLVIEIQRIHYGDHYDRFFYYFMVVIIELVKSHKSYYMNRSVYTIVWLTGKVREKENQESILTNYFMTETNQGKVVKNIPTNSSFSTRIMLMNIRLKAWLIGWHLYLKASITQQIQNSILSEISSIKRRVLFRKMG